MSLLAQTSLMAFIQENDVKNETGEPLDFKKYRFMYDVYCDRSPLICCMKCAQIGFTTYEILKSAHECMNEGYDIIYVLPTGDDVKKFSGGKTNKMLAQNPAMQAWTKDKDSIEQKQFGRNTIYYQGSWTERAALMITAKKLIVDEYDRCKQAIVEQYDSRLQSVADPKKAFFSNPSLPDFAIDKLYKSSDQKKWHVTHSCGETYVMDERCINYETEIYECPKCRREILDEERRMGEWFMTDNFIMNNPFSNIDQLPTSDMKGMLRMRKRKDESVWSGYWIPLWIAPWMPASKIAQMKREKTPEFFANFVAGLPYVGGGNKVSAETILKNLDASVNLQEGRIIIGVDTGLPIHYVVGNRQGLFFYGTCTSYDELEALLRRYPRSVLVSDQGGDLIGIRALQERFRGRVFLCYYRQNRKTNELITWGEGDKYGEVVVDRNRTLQMLIDEMQDRRFPISGSPADWQDYVVHWLNIYRTKEENALGVMEYRWERTGPDHWAHATLYFRVGMDRFSEASATVVGKSDFLKGVPTGRNFNFENGPMDYGQTNHYTPEF